MKARPDNKARAERSRRLSGLRSYVLCELPRARTGARERDLASQRAKNAILALGFVLEDLADEHADAGRVQRAMRAADDAYRAAVLHGKSIETNAAMEMVSYIRDVAGEVLAGRARVADVEFSSLGLRVDFVGFPGSTTPVDHLAFREAVGAWVTSEQAMCRPGRRDGRTPDRWGPTFECLKRFGLQNGISSDKALKDMWGKSRGRTAIPLSEM
jgi:hypothetical protein